MSDQSELAPLSPKRPQRRQPGGEHSGPSCGNLNPGCQDKRLSGSLGTTTTPDIVSPTKSSGFSLPTFYPCTTTRAQGNEMTPLQPRKQASKRRPRDVSRPPSREVSHRAECNVAPGKQKERLRRPLDLQLRPIPVSGLPLFFSRNSSDRPPFHPCSQTSPEFPSTHGCIRMPGDAHC